MKVPVADKTGKKIKDLQLKREISQVKINESVVHQVIRAQLAAARTGTASTKTRSELRGGGRKPWRQKGTGRARAGSIRSPLWAGGGTVFGPKARNYAITVPKRVKKLALKSILAMKVKEGKVVIVDDFGLTEPKTKIARETLRNLGATEKTTVIVSRDEEVVARSTRNLKGVRVVYSNNVNAYDLLNNDKLVITKEAFGQVQEVLSS